MSIAPTHDYAGPLPVIDPESAPFWAGLREGRLMLQRCASGEHLFPPVTFCPGSLERPEWVQASGRGRIFSWIVVRHPVPREIYQDKAPYVVALVELEEGCRMVANVVGCPPESLVADMPVEIGFKPVTDEITLPEFRPRGG